MAHQRTAFVTGATGFLGGHLCQQLVSSGWRVHAIFRSSGQTEALKESGVQLAQGDVTALDSLLQAMPESPDAVFHVAADTTMWKPYAQRQWRINVEGTQNCLKAAKQRGARCFIHTSSVSAYGFHSGQLTEQTPRDTDSHWIGYYRSKAAAEDVVQQVSGLRRVLLNPGHIMGPGDRHNWSRMIRMIQHQSLPGIPPGSGAFADVREVARAHIRAVDHGQNGENYLLGGEHHSFKAVVAEIGRQLSVPVPNRVTPAWLLKIVATVRDLKGRLRGQEPDLTPQGAAIVCHKGDVCSDKAIASLDYRITPLPELLADTITWMRSEGML